MKDGARRVVWREGDTSSVAPVAPVEKVVDATGAGDSFNGAYLAARLQGHFAEDAPSLGNLAENSSSKRASSQGEEQTHSMRRTKVALIYKRTGNLRAVQILLGHSKLESAVRYLGVDIDDALTLSEADDL